MVDAKGAEGNDPGSIDGDAITQLEALYHEQSRPSVRLVHAMVGDHGWAEELTQDAFVRLAPRLDDLDNPAGYLRTTLVKLCRDEVRHRQVVRRHPPEPLADATAPGVPTTTTAVWPALQGLPHRQRAALTLRFYADASTDEIATLLDARPATVRSLIHGGLTTLRKVVPND